MLAWELKLMCNFIDVNAWVFDFYEKVNRDPVANMLGERFATVEGDDNSIFRFIEEITKEIEQLAKQHAENEGNTEKQEEIEEKKLVLKMRLILLRLDQQLLNQSIAQITKYVYYDIDSTYPHPTHPLFFFLHRQIHYTDTVYTI